MKTGSSSPELTIPPALLARIEAEAAAEHRSAVAVLEDAVHDYVSRKRRERLVFRTEDLSEAEVAAIVGGRMDPRHDPLDAELE